MLARETNGRWGCMPIFVSLYSVSTEGDTLVQNILFHSQRQPWPGGLPPCRLVLSFLWPLLVWMVEPLPKRFNSTYILDENIKSLSINVSQILCFPFIPPANINSAFWLCMLVWAGSHYVAQAALKCESLVLLFSLLWFQACGPNKLDHWQSQCCLLIYNPFSFFLTIFFKKLIISMLFRWLLSGLQIENTWAQPLASQFHEKGNTSKMLKILSEFFSFFTFDGF